MRIEMLQSSNELQHTQPNGPMMVPWRSPPVDLNIGWTTPANIGKIGNFIDFPYSKVAWSSPTICYSLSVGVVL
jgi:hypothetical protein